MNSIYPTGEEDKFVMPNSNTLSCQAGSPRGCYNMGQTCYLSVILQAMVHNPLMRNYFLSGRHDATECEVDNCVICALTISFCDILATEKLDGHGPVDLLYRSWKHNAVSIFKSIEDVYWQFRILLAMHNKMHTNITSLWSTTCIPQSPPTLQSSRRIANVYFIKYSQADWEVQWLACHVRIWQWLRRLSST